MIWNIEKGCKIDLDELEQAENQRVALAQRYLAFFDKYDLLLTPATVVAPYPIENRYVAEVNGHKFANYVEWLAIAYAITVPCGTALSLPCGFTSEKLPVGLQIAGAAAQRGAHPRGREGAGGHARRARDDADRSARDASGARLNRCHSRAPPLHLDRRLNAGGEVRQHVQQDGEQRRAARPAQPAEQQADQENLCRA